MLSATTDVRNSEVLHARRCQTYTQVELRHRGVEGLRTHLHICGGQELYNKLLDGSCMDFNDTKQGSPH
jgi:hypothetical protein